MLCRIVHIYLAVTPGVTVYITDILYHFIIDYAIKKLAWVNYIIGVRGIVIIIKQNKHMKKTAAHGPLKVYNKIRKQKKAFHQYIYWRYSLVYNLVPKKCYHVTVILQERSRQQNWEPSPEAS